MDYKIEQIEGIGPSYAEKLGTMGIKTTGQFLDACCDAGGRRVLSQRSGLSEPQLLKWANLADLMRISGIGPQYSELLEAAGVDTVLELRNRRAESLMAKMEEVNTTRKLARALPTVTTVQDWIRQAQTTEPRITH